MPRRARAAAAARLPGGRLQVAGQHEPRPRVHEDLVACGDGVGEMDFAGRDMMLVGRAALEPLVVALRRRDVEVQVDVVRESRGGDEKSGGGEQLWAHGNDLRDFRSLPRMAKSIPRASPEEKSTGWADVPPFNDP